MKRLLVDFCVLIFFIAEYFCEQALAGAAPSSIALTLFDPLLMFVGVAGLAAFVRGVAEERIFVSPTMLWVGMLEWIFLVVISYVLTCALDAKRHPPENFVTVFGFGLFILLMPALIISTGVYVATRSFFKVSRKDRSFV